MNLIMLRRLLLSTVLLCLCLSAEEPIPPGSKVFIAPMDGFETHLKTALVAKKVPLTVVEDRSSADFEISGAAESEKASTAKKIIMWDWRSKEQATIKVTNLKTSVVAFAYSVHKASSAHGKRSSAEACAKHLNEKVKASAAKPKK